MKPSAILRHVFLASLWRRRLATTLSLVAIALGVALGLAVQLIHDAALDEFGHGLRLLSGEADLQVVGPQSGFDEAIYPLLAQRPEVVEASPLVEVEARLPGLAQNLRILGIDLFRAAWITPALLPIVAQEPAADKPAAGQDLRLETLRGDALFLSPAAASRLDLKVGERLGVQVGTRSVELRIAGSVPNAGLGQALAIMDIAAAQLTFERLGRLSRIDLQLARGVDRDQARRTLSGLLPPGVNLRTPAEAESEVLGLSRAYRVNLTMLAAIALFTGAFLVFSAQWLAVVRRRQEFALLRALGLDRGGLLGGLLAEGALLGLLGGLLGLVLGYGLTALALKLIGGDLGAGYFQGLRPALELKPALMLAYLGLGVGAGLGGAWLPAREAARMVPARGLHAGDEVDAYGSTPGWRWTLGVLGLVALLCLLPPVAGLPLFGYLAVALLLIGAVMTLPGLTPWSLRLLPIQRSILPRLARARLSAAPGQAVVAGAGVVASAALAVSMAIMVSSFRDSLHSWLDRMLPADLYLRTATAGSSGYVEPETLARLAGLPGVGAVHPVRFESLRLETLPTGITLLARVVQAGAGLPLVAGSIQPGGSQDAAVLPRLTDPLAPSPSPAGGEGCKELPGLTGCLSPGPSLGGEVGREKGLPPSWISEALADRLGLQPGDDILIPLGGQRHSFRIAGIWRDYARQQGSIVIELDLFQALTGDRRVNDLGFYLNPGTPPQEVMLAIRALLGDQAAEMILPGELKAMILRIFDRTFLVTYLMELVAIVIGLFGISTSFAALAISRRKELGILRHLGLPRRQIGGLLATEAALTALLGVGVGLIAGGAIALILIKVINPQSFHWSMDVHPPWEVLALFSLSMIGLSALAARLSGRQAMRQEAVLAVREDW